MNAGAVDAPFIAYRCSYVGTLRRRLFRFHRLASTDSTTSCHVSGRFLCLPAPLQDPTPCVTYLRAVLYRRTFMPAVTYLPGDDVLPRNSIPWIRCSTRTRCCLPPPYVTCPATPAYLPTLPTTYHLPQRTGTAAAISFVTAHLYR